MTKRSVITAVALAILVMSCSPMSSEYPGTSTGLNGSFEMVESGFPANWIIYTSETTETGEFFILVDTTTFRHGQNSLRFDVESCSEIGGWKSPGIAREIEYEPGEYELSFWVKGNRSRIQVKAGSVSAKKGDLNVVLDNELAGNEWAAYNHRITVSKDYPRIRFQFNVLSPGQVWLDDVQITPVD